MSFDLEYEFQLLYERWLLENYPDEIHNKDDLIDKVCDGFEYDEFIEKIEKVM